MEQVVGVGGESALADSQAVGVADNLAAVRTNPSMSLAVHAALIRTGGLAGQVIDGRGG